MSTGDRFYSLLKIHLQVKKYLFFDQLQVFKFYFRYPKLFLCDCLFFLFYLFQNPYRISRKFYQFQNKPVEPYGETSFSALRTIIDHSGITDKDTVIELGSGRSKSAFWTHLLTGCKVYGYEWIGSFVKKALRIQKLLQVPSVEIFQKNFFEADIHTASVLYLYGTCMDETQIDRFLEKIRFISQNVKIITISFPLSDYVDRGIETIHAFDVSFPWGQTKAFVQKRKSDIVLKN